MRDNNNKQHNDELKNEPVSDAVDDQTVVQGDVTDQPVAQDDLNMKQLEERVKSLEDQLKRAVADYQNLEKRVSEGRSELTSWAATELIKKVLPVLDHLEKAVGGMSDEEKNSGWAKGVKIAVNEFKQVLKSEGLEEVETEGQFDPSLHEAVDMQEGEDNKILMVAESGYRLNGKIVRPAKVIVGKKGEK